MSVEVAVFPVAGMGTRFLPATKATPKEMLPIVDKPLIQYAVEEAVAAGVKELVFVTSYSKRAIEDHFDTNYELEKRLEEAGKQEALESVRNILPKDVTSVYIRQPEPLGLGHAVLCAKPVVGDRPFAVLLADDLIDGGDRPCLKDMVDIYNEAGIGSIAVEDVPKEETFRYGIMEVEDRRGRDLIRSIVEKPKPEDAPSTLAAVGRYVLPGRIFEILERTPRGAGNELQLTDAIAALVETTNLEAHRFHGVRYDCGNKLGYLEATIAFGMKDANIADEIRKVVCK